MEERGREGFSCPSWRKFLAYVCLSFSSPPSLTPISFLPPPFPSSIHQTGREATAAGMEEGIEGDELGAKGRRPDRPSVRSPFAGRRHHLSEGGRAEGGQF